MNMVSLSLALSPREIQRIRTSLAPFPTIHFSSTASEETFFRGIDRLKAVAESPAPGIRIREPFVWTRLVPVPVPTSWQPDVGYFSSPYKATLIGTSFKQIVVFAHLKK
jgi:hypothetical protein